MRKSMRMAPALAIALLAAPMSSEAGSSEIVFTKLVEDESRTPEGWSLSPFFGEDGPGYPYPDPTVAMDDEGNLAFAAVVHGSPGLSFIAILGGQIHRVPYNVSHDWGQIDIERGRVTFGDIDEDGGILRLEEGRIVDVVKTGTPVPGTDVCVFFAHDEVGVSNHLFSVDDGAVLFTGTIDGPYFDCDHLEGRYLWRDGSIERLGLEAAIDAGLIAFVSDDGALYARELEGAPQRIVGPGDPMPGRAAVFESVGAPAVAGGRIAFLGRDPGGIQGVYLWDSGTLSALAEEGMSLPGDRRLLFHWQYPPFRLGEDRIAIAGREGPASLLYLASIDRDWVRLFDPSDLEAFGGSEDMGCFDRNQIVIGSNVLRADGSYVRILQALFGDALQGRSLHRYKMGDLRRDELAFGVALWDPTEYTISRQIYLAELPPLAVAVDVRPHVRSNRIHPRSRRSIRIALFGSERFYVEDVDVASLALGPDAAPPVGRVKRRDVNGDGWDDLVVRFRPRQTGIDADATELCLSGETLDGLGFEGCDAIRTKGRTRRVSAR